MVIIDVALEMEGRWSGAEAGVERRGRGGIVLRSSVFLWNP